MGYCFKGQHSFRTCIFCQLSLLLEMLNIASAFTAVNRMKSNQSKSPVQDPAEEFNQPGEGRFRLAFDSASIGMAIIGLDYRIKQVNKSLCAALGYTPDGLLEHKFIDFTHADDRHRDQKLVEQLLDGQIPSYRFEKRFITKDGSLVWLDFTAVMIREKQAEPLYVFAMAENITERKRIHEALRASEERYRSFVVNSSEGIWRFEVEQPIDTSLPTEEQIALFYKYAYLAECNDAMARMYGHQRAEDIVGSSFGDLTLASNPADTSSMRKFITGGYRLLDVETEELDSNGSRKHFSNNVIGIVLNGMLLRIWGVQRDETEKKRAERDLERSRRQLRALAAHLQSIREKERADLAREMHDVLGQSLASLKIDFSWLRKKLTSVKTGTTLLDEKLNEINGLLNETIASVKSLSTELRPGVLDKFGLGAAIEWQCEEFGRRSGIEHECRVPRKEFSLAPEKSIGLFRIVQEALTNVARHSQATTVRVELALKRPDVALTVADNGRGITAAERVAPESLGLLGMRERAELLGGSLSIKGQPGEGTEVKVTIPLTDSNGATQRIKN